jgi:hypothetical protein
MIGVAARAADHAVVREFFELFKTPWEPAREGGRYDVLLDAGGGAAPGAAPLVVGFGSGPTRLDEAAHRRPGPARDGVTLSWRGLPLPLRGPCAALPGDGRAPDLTVADTAEPAAVVTRSGERTVVRVGYDLFGEVAALLAAGQPPAHAAVPTLERHIALLRHWIVAAGLPLVEIPPVPDGHRFTVCLTHDLDHPSLRLHRLDHTMLGFLHRALVGSALDVGRGRRPVGVLGRNLAAVARLPLVHLGWAEDPWARFDRYLDIERGLGSTFFAIPTRRDPGRTPDGPAPRRRAAAYGAADIAGRLRPLVAAGAEVGVHGLDAWLDAARGAAERETVTLAAGAPATGVRMHWLFWDQQAPARLEDAGFAYDSTVGYNETVGFRAGTLQAFVPPGARRLLELPLHVMDTALFYPGHLGLTPDEAWDRVAPLVDEAERHGGALTVNWHDRSIAPERLWDGFYRGLLEELKRREAWFPTMREAAAWFRRRRAASVAWRRAADGTAEIAASDPEAGPTPGLRVRVHAPGRPGVFTDRPLSAAPDARAALAAP